MPKPKVAFVVQRAGAGVIGGAESFCFQLAQRLGEAWNIDLLTTCARDYMTWKNFYPEGHSYEEGVHIQRFPVDQPRNVAHFNKLSEEIRFDIEASTAAMQERWMREQGPRCSQLARYVDVHAPRYDAFFFFGYLYATTYDILPRVEERSFLVPFAHDEWPIRMRMWDTFFTRPRCLIFNTPEEHDFVLRRFPAVADGPIFGAGVHPPAELDPVAFRTRFKIFDHFMLYLGRIDRSKGCDVLIDDFLAYRRAHASPAKLVLAGDKQMPVERDENIVVLEAVDEASKWNALAACDLLVMPSAHESLSLSVLEAWAVGKPVLVNAHSSVLVGQSRRSGGGLWYANAGEFEAALGVMDEQVCKDLGLQGRQFVNTNYAWPMIQAGYESLLRSS